jgi:hypothetical protein
MGRVGLIAAVVLGVWKTAVAVVALGSTIALTVGGARTTPVQPLTWWHVEIVLTAAVNAAWTALVPFVVVQACRRWSARTPLGS